MKKQGETNAAPSYTRQVPVMYDNKSLRRETRVMTGDGGSGAISTMRVVTKEQRKTGRVS